MASAEVVVALPAPSLSVSDPAKKKPIQIAHAKKPLFFYVNLAKRRFQEDHEVELSALGNAISTAVKVSEILKNTGFALLKDIDISSVPVENKILGRMMFKARIVLVLKKTEKADSPVAEFGTTDKDDSPKGPLTSDGSEDSADGEHKEATDGDNKNPSEVAVKEEVFVKEEEKEIKYEQSY